MGRLAQIPIPPPISGRITIVGVCGTGKSTLAANLTKHGYDAHECLQEHSFIQDMWRRISRPQILIVLQAEYKTVLARQYTDITHEIYADEYRKLANARANARILVNTDKLNAAQVAAFVISSLAPYRLGRV
ncbi:MAG: hypothetical protein ACYC6L_16535 [Anaerolineae bacterium]